jgi:DedD protein
VERRVQERLIGAAVLMAAAIILIPEMLSGTRRQERVPTTVQSGDGAFKTLTIDLSRSPGAAPSAVGDDERMPPPEINPSTSSQPQPSDVETPASRPSENPANVPQAVPERTEPAPQPQSRIAATPPPHAAPTPAPSTRAQPPPAANAPAAIASAPAAPTSRGWAVQLGSFASRATADRMVKDLSQQGQNAFVMPVKSGAATLYRVRLGPFAERTRANEALREVKGHVANAAVVAHP